MKRLLIFCLSVITLAACNKDKFTTQPQVEIKSLSPEEVNKGQLISFTATVRDKEGDLDSVLLVRKRFNGTNLLTTDTIRNSLESFSIPARDQFDISVLISYGEQMPDFTAFHENLATADNRFLAFGIVVKDKEGNRSDYVESDKVLLRKL